MNAGKNPVKHFILEFCFDNFSVPFYTGIYQTSYKNLQKRIFDRVTLFVRCANNQVVITKYFRCLTNIVIIRVIRNDVTSLKNLTTTSGLFSSLLLTSLASRFYQRFYHYIWSLKYKQIHYFHFIFIFSSFTYKFINNLHHT